MENNSVNNDVPYIDNKEDKISGLVGTSLGGYILSKTYKRPDPQNIDGVFDYGMDKKEQQDIANKIALQDLADKKESLQPPLMDKAPINPSDSDISKLLNQNNIEDNKSISPYGLFPEVIFPKINQPLPTAKSIEGFGDNKCNLMYIFFLITIISIIIIYNL